MKGRRKAHARPRADGDEKPGQVSHPDSTPVTPLYRRTDAALNELGDPLMLYCQPANDYLPDPQSCLITGITPQLCLEKIPG